MNVIKFPAFGKSKWGSLTPLINLKRLQTTTLKTFKNGWYDELLIYDAEGRLFKVLHTSRDKTYIGIDFFLGNPFIEVKLEVVLIGNYSIEELKKMVLNDIKSNRSYWDNISMYGLTIDKVNNAESVEQLFRVYGLPKT